MDYRNNTIKPVLFMVFNRPEKTARVWEQIRKAKPRKLYISADGPRVNRPSDKEKCDQVRKIVSNIEWNCDVKYLLHDKNLGCTLAGKTAFDWVFSQEDEMIQLEDDVLPTQSFFWFTQEMLDKYKNNPKICYVCAENFGIKYGDATYFFTQYGGSGGWATWKRVYEEWEYKLDSLEFVVNTKSFKNSFHSNFQYNYWKNGFYNWKYKGGNTYDLQTIYLIHKKNLINIVPNINLTTNIGWDNEAANSVLVDNNDKLALKFGNIPSFELSSIIHPEKIEASPEIDTKWFKYHFQGDFPEIYFKLRWWFSSPFFNPLKKIFKPVYRSIFKY
ncbi:MAG: glyocosyltransferase [Bacteroidetes bacterium HGW-Bacteroidetes-8]|jgi:hypothetical protein|nr:MAG: glyocosyltransferase [Bacteroidetes bacterium HGW-Bacteroidetes-8]